jgi:hypothetical protein
MSQERWDVVLRFLDGPLAVQGDLVCRGPVVRIGANPGPGGLSLPGYRALDDRHAVITCYDGGSVSIAPVGLNQVRVALHANVDWAEIQPLQGPVHLSADSVIHMGPVGRGATVQYMEAQRLGVWQQGNILSDAAQANPEVEPSEVRVLDAKRGVPAWFVPGIVSMFVFTAAVVLFAVIAGRFIGDIPRIGPEMEGFEYITNVDVKVKVPPQLFDGMRQPFFDFVMKPNAEVAKWPRLGKNDELWDKRFYEYTVRMVNVYAQYWAFWNRLELIREDYAFVVKRLRKSKLPEVFAAIPYQESRYRPKVQSIACAVGWWQFIPEAAKRANVEVRDCRFKGVQDLWSPTRLAPVRGVMRNAPYTGGRNCRITTCAVDERHDLAISTRGAMELLSDAWVDPLFRDSGAGVQMTILSHNAGYDDSRFEERHVNSINILHAYKKHLKRKKLERAPDFYGENITCVDLKQEDYASMSAMCGESVLWNHSQHYAYNIVAQHILAVCYYGKNHSDIRAFKQWRHYARPDSYCETHLKIPTSEEVLKRSGRGPKKKGKK